MTYHCHNMQTTHKDCRSDSVGINQNNTNMSDYFKSRTNIEVDKEDSRWIKQKFHCKFSDEVTEFDSLRAYSN